MSNSAFEIGDAFRRGWQVVRSRLGFFVGALLLTFVVVLAPEALGMVVANAGGGEASAAQGIVMMVAGIVVMLLAALLILGWIRVALRSLDGVEVGFGALFQETGALVRYVGAWILYSLAVGIGFLLLVIPGIYLSVKYSLFPFFLVEREMGPVESMKASGEAVEGNWWLLLGFFAATMILNTVGGLVVVGVLVTYPLTLVATAWVYRRLAETAAAEV